MIAPEPPSESTKARLRQAGLAHLATAPPKGYVRPTPQPSINIEPGAAGHRAFGKLPIDRPTGPTRQNVKARRDYAGSRLNRTDITKYSKKLGITGTNEQMLRKALAQRRDVQKRQLASGRFRVKGESRLRALDVLIDSLRMERRGTREAAELAEVYMHVEFGMPLNEKWSEAARQAAIAARKARKGGKNWRKEARKAYLKTAGFAAVAGDKAAKWAHRINYPEGGWSGSVRNVTGQTRQSWRRKWDRFGVV